MSAAAPSRRTSIVITGASSGLGGQLARLYAAPGVNLGLIGRNEARLMHGAEICRGLGAEVTAERRDVCDAGPLANWLLDLDDRAPIDLLIANAGTSGGPAPGAPGEGQALATRQIATNLLGAVNTIEPLLPRFAARRSGRIVLVGSIAGYRGLPDSPAYSASKAGVRAYGEALRARLAPSGVGVSVVCPGFFDSPMTDRFKGATPFLYSLERAAISVKRGIDRGRPRIGFPWPLVLGLRLADLIPAWLGDAILNHFRFHILSD